MFDVLISIVIATYNAEQYISNCIDSILKQTHKKFELIIVNDGSVDSTAVICNEYAARDSRIKVFHQDNHGVGFARNKGLANASGEYVTFIDSDDEVSDKYLERLLLPCMKNHADISVCLYQYVSKDEEYTPVITGEYCILSVDYHILQAKIIGRCCGTLINKKLLNEVFFDTDLFVGEDLLFFCKALSHAEKISITEDQLYCYNIYDESSYSGTYNEKKFTEIISWNRVLALFQDKSEIFRNTLYRLYGWILLNNILRMEESNYINQSHRKLCLSQLRKMTKYVFGFCRGGGKRSVAMYPVYLVTSMSPKMGYIMFSRLMWMKHSIRKNK
ncbi:MAG: glycosyltransferase family 2 protein [Clostridia bacterium]|nr:glycosyltransferase family 2 protein [Clostridia bacterium]